jgi:acylphosphatase
MIKVGTGPRRRNGWAAIACRNALSLALFCLHKRDTGRFMADELTHLRMRVEGFVQAVGYRNFAIEEATRLGLDGWVRNRSDGTVEILVSGETKPVETFVAAAMRGPAGSRVKNVELHSAEPPDEKGFRRRASL